MTKNLIPVQRPDKNGHMVTRWVRPDTQSSAGKAIPAVKQDKPHGIKELKSLLTATIDNNAYEDTNLKPKTALFKHMASLSDSTLDSYLNAIKHHPTKYCSDLLLSVLNNGDDDQKAQYVLAVTMLDNQIDPEWGDGIGGTYAYHSATQVLKGLYMYEWSGFRPPEDITDKSDPAVHQARALITVINRLWENGDEMHLIDDTMSINDGNLVSLVLERPEEAEKIASIAHDIDSMDGRLVRLILENPEDADEISATIRNTGTKDIDRLREMMATSSSSLKSGVL